MSIVSSGALIDALRQCQLLPPERMAELPRLASSRSGDPRHLAKTLVQRGWLTVYQANHLLAGKGYELVFGPYHILDRLGSGGQSLVYKAWNPFYRCMVALKVLRTEALETPEARLQFLQEMEAMGRMDHPNVVQFCDVDQVGGTFYCAMEYVEGTDLGKAVRLEAMLPPARAADYVRQTALGLQHAHEHNLIHRDIKPVNLLLTHPRGSSEGAPGVVKILDWGLACLKLPGERASARPASGGILGTADYLSPEQARDAGAADIRSDIYSLGCTFYYLLTGDVPFPGATLMQKLMAHQSAEPPPVESRNPAVPPGLAAIVRRMMAKKPEDRFQTPVAVALALAPYCRVAQLTTVPPRRDGSAATHEDTPLPASLPPRPEPPKHRTETLARRPQETPTPADTRHR